MTKRRKRILLSLIAIAILAVAAAGALYATGVWGPVSQPQATRRAQQFAREVNYNYEEPARLYPLMTKEYRQAITEADFVAAFQKERSYPYLTPLFINFDRVELAADGRTGTAYFSQAARLPGMVYTLRLTYENGNYYVTAFEEFLDGSYLEKFDRL